MDVTALCSRLLMNLLMLLGAQPQHCWCAQKADLSFPRIEPNALQFFQNTSITVNCMELGGDWRVTRKLKHGPTVITRRETSPGSVTIKSALTSDSGEYWCENKDGERSNGVNIIVTAGDVILEIPAAVTEGDNVTLYCRQKRTSYNLSADFFKDSLPRGTERKGRFLINNVSKASEGFYKCINHGYGESAQSWLTVRAQIISPTSETPSVDASPPPSSHSVYYVHIISSVAVLLLVTGLVYCCKRTVSCFSSETTTPVSEEASFADSQPVIYAQVTTRSKKREPESSSNSAGLTTEVIYATVHNRSTPA